MCSLECVIFSSSVIMCFVFLTQIRNYKFCNYNFVAYATLMRCVTSLIIKLDGFVKLQKFSLMKCVMVKLLNYF